MATNRIRISFMSYLIQWRISIQLYKLCSIKWESECGSWIGKDVGGSSCSLF